MTYQPGHFPSLKSLELRLTLAGRTPFTGEIIPGRTTVKNLVFLT